MARTAITEAAVALNAGTAPVTTAVDPTNGHVVSFKKSRRLLIRANFTFAGSKNLTVKAGSRDAGAPKGGQGDLVVAINNASRYIVVESARFLQADGNCYIDIEASTTGTIEAIRLPAVA